MRKLAFLLILALGCVACMPSVRVMRYTPAIYPPSSNVEILRTKPADREYVEIGEVSIRLTRASSETAVLMLAQKAKELGADALILIGERQKGETYVPIGRLLVGVNRQDIIGVAIRYKQEK